MRSSQQVLFKGAVYIVSAEIWRKLNPWKSLVLQVRPLRADQTSRLSLRTHREENLRIASTCAKCLPLEKIFMWWIAMNARCEIWKTGLVSKYTTRDSGNFHLLNFHRVLSNKNFLKWQVWCECTPHSENLTSLRIWSDMSKHAQFYFNYSRLTNMITQLATY